MSEEKTTTFKITTCMRGLQKWIDAHPRKNLRGFFTVNGRDMSHNEVKRVVAYAVSKGHSCMSASLMFAMLHVFSPNGEELVKELEGL